jgi:thiazole synthase/sulfur carrier protein
MSGAGESKIASTTGEVVEITVNGELKQVPADLDVPRLLDHLGIRSDRVAIERNLDILPKDRWKETVVGSGDRYEIVHFVGGG